MLLGSNKSSISMLLILAIYMVGMLFAVVVFQLLSQGSWTPESLFNLG